MSVSDNTGFPSKRRSDIGAYVAFTRRIMAALEARSGLSDQMCLGALAELSRDMDRVIVRVARELHSQGYSWGDIGRGLGITRQAARQRFADKEEVA